MVLGIIVPLATIGAVSKLAREKLPREKLPKKKKRKAPKKTARPNKFKGLI